VKADEKIGTELSNSEIVGASQPPASLLRPQKTTKEMSRRTRGGRITKNTTQSQGIGNGQTLSRQAVPTPAEALTPDCRLKRLRQVSDMVGEPDNSPPQVPRKPHKKQRKVYKQERESRRLAGHLPEFGLLPKRGEPAPPYETLLRCPSNTRNPNPLGHRSRASSKQSIAVKCAKPQGISKSRREETYSLKRSKSNRESRN
jgi:hypothetical protein